MNEQRWATYTRKCDENGNIVKGVYLGIDQKVCPLSNDGGIIGKEYDEHGNSITESIFDKDGQLAWGREGVARCVAKYKEESSKRQIMGQTVICVLIRRKTLFE